MLLVLIHVKLIYSFFPSVSLLFHVVADRSRCSVIAPLEFNLPSNRIGVSFLDHWLGILFGTGDTSSTELSHMATNVAYRVLPWVLGLSALWSGPVRIFSLRLLP